MVERVRPMMRHPGAPGSSARSAPCATAPTAPPLLATLAGFPTLVMVGAEDEITPPTGPRDGRRHPRRQPRVIRGAGHLPPLEQPVRPPTRFGVPRRTA